MLYYYRKQWSRLSSQGFGSQLPTHRNIPSEPGAGLLSWWLSSHYHGGVHDEKSVARHTVNLLTSTIEIDADQSDMRFCFRIISPTKSYTLQAESAPDQMDWIEKITGVIASLLSCQSPERVRSLALDVKAWEPSVITLFQALGNVYVNSIWEGLLHARRTYQADEIPMKFFESDKHKQFFSKPSHDDHISVKEKFIHAKYAEKRFVKKVKDNQQLLLVAQQLWEGVRTNDKKAVYRLIIICEADVNAIHGQASPSQSLSLTNVIKWQEQTNFDCSFDCLEGDSLDKVSSSCLGSLRGKEGQLIDEVFDGCSLLHLACQTADIGMVELLLQHGANINASDSRGQTPLHHSIIRGRIAIAKMLLTRGADPQAVNREGKTPLQLVTESDLNDVEILALLKNTYS